MQQAGVDRSIELSKRCKLHRDTSSIKYVHCRGDVTQAAGTREHRCRSRYVVSQRAAGTPTMRQAGVNRSIDSSNAANSIETLNRLSMSMRQGHVWQAAGTRKHRARSRHLVSQPAARTPTMRQAGVNRSIDSSNAANVIEILNRLSMSMRQGDANRSIASSTTSCIAEEPKKLNRGRQACKSIDIDRDT